MASAQKAQRGDGVRGVVLGEGGKVEGAGTQEVAKQGRSEQGEIARVTGVAAQFGVFAPRDVAAIVVGAFDPPMTAAAGEPLAGSERDACCG